MNEIKNHTIGGAFDEIEQSSLKAWNLDAIYQEVLDHYLEAIDDFTNVVNQKIQLMEVVSNQLEKLTWIETTSNNETIQKVSTILHTCKGILYGFDNDLKAMEKNKIESHCPNIVLRFRNKLEILEESIEDTRMIFFELRTDSDFNALDKEISMFNFFLLYPPCKR